MEVEDWESLVTMYTTYDADGNISKDSILVECTVSEYADWLQECSFLLGKVKNPKAFGITDKIQPTAGWLSSPGSYGVYWYSGEWIKKKVLFTPNSEL